MNVNRRFFLHMPLAVILLISLTAAGQNADNLKLKDFRPVSIYKSPQTNVPRAKFPAIDVHSHDYFKTDAEVDEWVKMMDECNIQKTLILSYSTGRSFDSVVDKYSRYKDRFDVWCGFDYTGIDQPGWREKAVAELVRCHQKGAKGVGELGDKGLGELYSNPTPGYGVHIDDPRVKPLIEKCGELNMPINIHVAEDEWMYLPSDSTNDGLMNAAEWKVDMSKPGILDHDQLVGTLEHAVRDNPGTTFIACHLANCCANLSKLGGLLDKYPNLYADIAARFGEISPVPRYTSAFINKYQDRLVYGTDMSSSRKIYAITFRILESADEHFYATDIFDYHWPLYGLALSDKVLKKLYHDNADKLISPKTKKSSR